MKISKSLLLLMVSLFLMVGFTSCSKDKDDKNSGTEEPGGGGGNGGGGGASAPSAPTGVTATTQSSSSINVSWNSVSEATSYEVYYEIGSSSTKNFASTVYSTSYSHTGLQSSTTYYYYIKAVNDAGSSGYSSYASATTSSGGGGGGGGGDELPCKPGVTGSISLTTLYANFWFSCTVSNVIVDVWNPKTSSWKSLTTLSGSATSYSISPYRDYMNTTDVSHPYYYFVKVRITGKNSKGTGDPSYIYYDILTGGVDYD